MPLNMHKNIMFLFSILTLTFKLYRDNDKVRAIVGRFLARYLLPSYKSTQRATCPTVRPATQQKLLYMILPLPKTTLTAALLSMLNRLLFASFSVNSKLLRAFRSFSVLFGPFRSFSVLSGSFRPPFRSFFRLFSVLFQAIAYQDKGQNVAVLRKEEGCALNNNRMINKFFLLINVTM